MLYAEQLLRGGKKGVKPNLNNMKLESLESSQFKVLDNKSKLQILGGVDNSYEVKDSMHDQYGGTTTFKLQVDGRWVDAEGERVTIDKVSGGIICREKQYGGVWY